MLYNIYYDITAISNINVESKYRKNNLELKTTIHIILCS